MGLYVMHEKVRLLLQPKVRSDCACDFDVQAGMNDHDIMSFNSVGLSV